jgi:hypothetical protein
MLSSEESRLFENERYPSNTASMYNLCDRSKHAYIKLAFMCLSSRISEN